MTTRFVSERNLKFMLYDVFDAIALTAHDRYRDHRRQAFDMIIDATLKLSRDLCRPTLKEMDEHPPVLENGTVKVHSQVRRFMRECGEGGWIAASFPYGLEGEQLPHLVNCACRYIFAAANYAMCVYPFLTAGAARLIASFGGPDLIDPHRARGRQFSGGHCHRGRARRKRRFLSPPGQKDFHLGRRS